VPRGQHDGSESLNPAWDINIFATLHKVDLPSEESYQTRASHVNTINRFPSKPTFHDVKRLHFLLASVRFQHMALYDTVRPRETETRFILILGIILRSLHLILPP
jgi:cobalamin biosynthesis protein CobD/CbiB